MKIGQEIRTMAEQRLQEGSKPSIKSGQFSSAVQTQQQKLQSGHLTALLTKVDQQGQRLLKSQTLGDLREYKRLVKRFVKETVDFGMHLKKSRSWNGHGHLETIHLVERIDEELLTLTDEMMNKETKAIDLLGRIGEIKGLLVNLYT
ncbi:YaaR family protein [Alkalihalobacillus sp. AL-G]|uniref:YaaR family protein n=1 Tax=Alkalihalobacillus sp. AL-G TaxID=2926399 RepID=UPI00272CAD30|nr:YaaR family protein [Alkalihalobacillus sp. AL-G]WLD93443.1 YaaR family protein [Alkalihalobacillus sp. AL-G]